MIMKFFLCLMLLAGSFLYANEKVDFAKDVEPILSDRCYKCHYDEKQKGDFTFLTRELVLKGGKDGGDKDVIPGNSKDSLLVHRILSDDPDEYMPPKGARLTDEQKSILKKWIDQGVVMPEFDEFGNPIEKKTEDNTGKEGSDAAKEPKAEEKPAKKDKKEKKDKKDKKEKDKK